ncbi:hypothetical protein F5Y12DRAFT_390267 [Xylaria sp. FL1777]|nr:hypothetical protein F5Y12DRAFT_390267 [Xylaria sp. FL1777]
MRKVTVHIPGLLPKDFESHRPPWSESGGECCDSNAAAKSPGTHGQQPTTLSYQSPGNCLRLKVPLAACGRNTYFAHRWPGTRTPDSKVCFTPQLDDDWVCLSEDTERGRCEKPENQIQFISEQQDEGICCLEDSEPSKLENRTQFSSVPEDEGSSCSEDLQSTSDSDGETICSSEDTEFEKSGYQVHSIPEPKHEAICHVAKSKIKYLESQVHKQGIHISLLINDMKMLELDYHNLMNEGESWKHLYFRKLSIVKLGGSDPATERVISWKNRHIASLEGDLVMMELDFHDLVTETAVWKRRYALAHSQLQVHSLSNQLSATKTGSCHSDAQSQSEQRLEKSRRQLKSKHCPTRRGLRRN